MPVNIKLIYFNGKGRAEPIRLLLAAADVDYEDVRYDADEWKEKKENTPWGQLPVLERDGKKFGDSGAILRLLAKEYKFYGRCSDEAGIIDSTCEQIKEIFTELGPILMIKDEKAKKESLVAYKDGDLKLHLEKLEYALKKNKNGDSFFVGDKMSVADILLFHAVDTITSNEVIADAINDKLCPKLMVLQQKVADNPGIAKWLVKRPVTSK